MGLFKSLINRFLVRFFKRNNLTKKSSYADMFNKATKGYVFDEKKTVFETVIDLTKRGLAYLSRRHRDIMQWIPGVPGASKGGYVSLIDEETYNKVDDLSYDFMDALKEKLEEPSYELTDIDILCVKFFGIIEYNKEFVSKRDIEKALGFYKYHEGINYEEIFEEEEILKYNLPRDLEVQISRVESFNQAFERTARYLKANKIITDFVYRGIVKNELENKIHLWTIQTDYNVINVRVPFRENGVYHLGHNQVVLNTPHRGSAGRLFSNQIRLQIRTAFRLANVFSFTNWALENEVQKVVYSLFFSDVVVRPMKKELEEELKQPYNVGVDPKVLEDNMTVLNNNATLTGYKGNEASDLANLLALTKETVVEVAHIKPLTNTLETIKNGGEFGLGSYKSFPLIPTYETYDPLIGGSSGKELYNYLNEDKIPLTCNYGISWAYDNRTIRTTYHTKLLAAAYKKKGKIDKPLTVSHKIEGAKEVPFYNMTVVFLENSNNLDTDFLVDEDKAIMSKSLADRLGAKDGEKMLLPGLTKVTIRVSDKDWFVDGEPVMFVSPIGMNNRENRGLVVAGRYNMQKKLDGNLEQEVRNPSDNPITEDEMARPMTVTGVNEEFEAFVGYLETIFVELPESFANSQGSKRGTMELGYEFFDRLLLKGANNLADELYGAVEEAAIRSLEIEEEFPGSAYGKKGKATKEFESIVKALFTTATTRKGISPGTSILNISDKDFGTYLHLMEFSKEEKEVAWNEFKKGTYTLKGLQMRHPLMNDASTTYNEITFKRVRGEKLKYYHTAFMEVNILEWIIKGGDFDGDQAFFVILETLSAIKEAKLYYGFELFNDGLITDSNWATENNLTMELTLQGMFNYIAKVKNRDLNAIGVKVEEVLKPMTVEEVKEKAAFNLLAVRLGKDAIGKAKGPIMRALTQFATLKVLSDISFYHSDNFSYKLAEEVLGILNEVSEHYVQGAINVEKWSEDIRKVFETILGIELYGSALTLLIDTAIINSGSLVSILRNMIPKAYHSIAINNFDEVIGRIPEAIERGANTFEGRRRKFLFDFLNTFADIRNYYKEIKIYNDKGRLVSTGKMGLTANPTLNYINEKQIREILETIKVDSKLVRDIESFAKEIVAEAFEGR